MRKVRTEVYSAKRMLCIIAGHSERSDEIFSLQSEKPNITFGNGETSDKHSFRYYITRKRREWWSAVATRNT